MRSAKVSFDFSGRPKLVELLRVHAAQSGHSQKEVVAEALEAYFAHHAESAQILKLAEKLGRTHGAPFSITLDNALDRGSRRSNDANATPRTSGSKLSVPNTW